MKKSEAAPAAPKNAAGLRTKRCRGQRPHLVARSGVLETRLQRFADTDRWPVCATPFDSQAVGLGSYDNAPLALQGAGPAAVLCGAIHLLGRLSSKVREDVSKDKGFTPGSRSSQPSGLVSPRDIRNGLRPPFWQQSPK